MLPDTALRTIEIDEVSVVRGDVRVLDALSVELDAARIAVVGANGSGKSTFARLLNGLVEPSSGHVQVHGIDVARRRREIHRRAGFVFTDPQAQILMPTAAEDLALSLRGLPRAEVNDRVAAMLAEHGLSDRADAPASALSGGQKQLLALASVLITDPALIIADEPTTLLDLRNARRIGDLLFAQPGQLVLATHDLELAARCDVAVLFEDGRITATGEAADVVAHYRRVCG